MILSSYALWCNPKKKSQHGGLIKMLQIQAVLLWGRNNFLFEIDDVLYNFYPEHFRLSIVLRIPSLMLRKKYIVKARNHATNRKALYTLTDEGKKEADRLKELYNIHDLRK